MLELRVGKVTMRDVNVWITIETKSGEYIGTLHIPKMRDWSLKQQFANAKLVRFFNETETKFLEVR